LDDLFKKVQLSEWSKDEKNLLLFFEASMVDHRCKIDGRRMNKIDFDIAKKWDKAGFIKFGRLKMEDINQSSNNNYNHYVILNPFSMQLAHRLRLERALRMEESFKQSVSGEYTF